jgi:hypothetical protein
VTEKIPVGTTPDEYFGFADVDPGNTFSDTNLADNLAISSNTATVISPFPNLLGTWAGPAVVKKGVGKGEIINQVITFTSESGTTGAFTFTVASHNPDGSTTDFAGQGTIGINGVFVDSGAAIPVDASGTLTAKGRVMGHRYRGTYVNAINSGTFNDSFVG